jgi:beta-glucosidase
MFERAYLHNAQRALNEGYPLIGYFPWSLMDNFEWSWGYTRRFGMTRIDYETQKRTPKESFRWYQKVIQENRVV